MRQTCCRAHGASKGPRNTPCPATASHALSDVNAKNFPEPNASTLTVPAIWASRTLQTVTSLPFKPRRDIASKVLSGLNCIVSDVGIGIRRGSIFPVSRLHSLISFWLPMLSHLPSGLKVSDVVPSTGREVLARLFDVVSHRRV